MLEAERFENHKDNAIAAHFRGQALAYATVLDGLDKLEQEQPEADITMEIEMRVMKLRTVPTYDELVRFARHFFELGQRKAADMYDEVEYNRLRAEIKRRIESFRHAAAHNEANALYGLLSFIDSIQQEQMKNYG